MVRFLLQRPIAVFMTFIVAMSLGLFLFFKVPVSLLPAVDVPQIIVKVNYPNTAANVLEENITRNIRENLVSLEGLVDIESQSTNQTATLNLTFDYATRMDLAYIAVNEKLDRLSNSLPKDLPRPQVMRINTTDIPIVHLQVLPKNTGDYVRVSELTERVIKKRIEQIDGVSVVDINGKRNNVITIEPDKRALAAIGLADADIEEAIRSANTDLGSLSVRDGQYRFFIKLANKLADIRQIAHIPLKLKDGTITTIEKFASIGMEPDEPQGYHFFNGRQGLVVTVQKQAGSRMNELVPRINDAIKTFRKDYPQVDFALTQDQTFLLDQGIQNLTQDLFYGGILCVALLFMFLGNYASPILMSISIPVSLFLTFIFFYFFNISFNIISLSGLALGIGMLIDNSIVVLDSITRKRKEGLSMDESCIVGVREVMSPVISNVLTTVAIYAPLIYMSGLAGALVYDQAISLTISLGVSLLVAFCLNPVMYKFLLKSDPQKLKEDTRFYLAILKGYHGMIDHVFHHKKRYFVMTLLIMPLGFCLFFFVPVTTLPAITETESLVKIDWNSPVDAEENASRLKKMAVVFRNQIEEWEADAGIKQFILQQDNNSIQKAEVYYRCLSEAKKKETDQAVDHWFKKNYPAADWKIEDAPNAFTQLFENQRPYLEARFKSFEPLPPDEFNFKLEMILKNIGKRKFSRGLSFISDLNIEMALDDHKMLLYGITKENIRQELERLFGSSVISEIKRFGDTQIIRFKTDAQTMDTKLSAQIAGSSGASYALSDFIHYTNGSSRKYILADKSGVYQSISFKKEDIGNTSELQKQLLKIAATDGFSVSFTGNYFANKSLMKDMAVIFVISLLLLYFVLAVQFENLVHPFLVMFTIPLGIGGAMLILWLAGGTLNIMAAIGFVVVLGIIVDDPSLKVETINRLRAEYVAAGMTDKREILLKALHGAGEICLKPLLMVSLTTSLALIPVFFTGGIGNDLQKPLVYIIVGGLTIGTFFTLWFIPLAYWFITKKDN